MSIISASTTTTTAYSVTADTTGTLVLKTGASPTTAVTIDGSQNMGLGVTPSAWYSTVKAVQFSTAGSVWALSGQNNSFLSTNEYLNSSASPIYIQTGYAMRYQQTQGEHRWHTAASGTAGNPITFTQAMTLDASNRLLVGLTSSIASNGIAQIGGNADTRLIVDGSSTQGIYFTKSGADNGTFRVDSSGNYNWFVKGAGTANMTLDSSGALIKYGSLGNITLSANGAAIQFSRTAENYFDATSSGGSFVWRINGNTGDPNMKLDSSGNLYLGITSSVLGGIFQLYRSNADGMTSKTDTAINNVPYFAWNAHTSGDNQFHRFYTEASYTQRGSIDYNRASNVTRYNTTSDATLKNIIGDAEANKSVEILSSTRIREYSWKSDESNKPQIGVIAQELYETFKGAVSVGGDMEKTDANGNATTEYVPWSVDKTAFTFHLVKGWQEHHRIIKEQQAIIETLTNRIQALENK